MLIQTRRRHARTWLGRLLVFLEAQWWNVWVVHHRILMGTELTALVSAPFGCHINKSTQAGVFIYILCHAVCVRYAVDPLCHAYIRLSMFAGEYLSCKACWFNFKWNHLWVRISKFYWSLQNIYWCLDLPFTLDGHGKSPSNCHTRHLATEVHPNYI